MARIMPVSVRNNQEGSRWFAFALSHDRQGVGKTREEALKDLQKSLRSLFPGEEVEIFVESENVNFPGGLTVPQYLEWLQDRAQVGSR